jgi:hypothetical protein
VLAGLEDQDLTVVLVRPAAQVVRPHTHQLEGSSMRRMICTAAVLAAGVGLCARPARADDTVRWGDGSMKNLYVDLVFWGWGQLYAEGAKIFLSDGVTEATDVEQVLHDVQDISNWLDSGWVFDDGTTAAGTPPIPPPPGWEPAVHYYGLSGIMPGAWVSESNPIPSQYLSCCGSSSLPDSDITSEVDVAHYYGLLGASLDFQNNVVDTNGLPASPNRLTLVITNGANDLAPSTGTPTNGGYHSSGTMLESAPGMNVPYGAVRFEGRYPNLAHEILEAMSDPFPWNGWVVVNPAGPFGLGTFSDEFADQCEGTYDGQDQLGMPGAAQNKLFGSSVGESNPPANFSVPSDSCLQFIPQQTAPLAATFEYGYRSQPLNLVFIDVGGHVQEMEWDSAGEPASGPVDLGPPSPTVAAAGKPSIVYSLDGFGERIFVKGTDNGLWMHWAPHGGIGEWVPLGGVIYGDPKAVLWDNDQLIDVFALGTDDNIYFYGMTPSTFYGWSELYWSGSSFVGSPTVVSRDGHSLDLFANGEDGGTRWMSCDSSTCWTSPDLLLGGLSFPEQGTPTVAVDSTNHTMELFARNLGGYMEQTSWSYPGGRWAGGNFLNPGTGSSLQGLASVSWGPGHFDAFSVTRQGELWWWYTNDPTNFGGWTSGEGFAPLVFGGGPYTASGDPLAITRYASEVEVFYRTTLGQLAHLTYSNGGWQWPPEISLPTNTIQ